MRYRRSSAFVRDMSRLPADHYALFRDAVYKHFLPALNAGALSGRVPWPNRLRIHRLVGTHIYSLTWNFAAPDGRATFSFITVHDGETELVWRRIGGHHIYDRP